MGLKSLLGKISEYVFNQKNIVRIFGATVLAAGNIAANLSIPYLFNKVVSLFSSKEQEIEIISGVKVSSVGMVGIYCTAWTFSRVLATQQKIIMTPMAMRAARKLAIKYLEHLMRLPLNYHLTTDAGGKIEIHNKAFSGMQEFVLLVFTQIIPITFEMLLAIGLLSQRGNPTVAIGLAAMLGVNTLYNLLASGKIAK